MRKQCVPGSAHALEPGNEAKCACDVTKSALQGLVYVVAVSSSIGFNTEWKCLNSYISKCIFVAVFPGSLLTSSIVCSLSGHSGESGNDV